MLSHDEIEIFTGREHRILADKHKNYLLAQLFFFCAEQRGKKTEERKWESEGRVKERGQKAGEEYGLGNWWKEKKNRKNKDTRGKRGQQRAEFTLGRLAAPQLPASRQIHLHLP